MICGALEKHLLTYLLACLDSSLRQLCDCSEQRRWLERPVDTRSHQNERRFCYNSTVAFRFHTAVGSLTVRISLDSEIAFWLHIYTKSNYTEARNNAERLFRTFTSLSRHEPQCLRPITIAGLFHRQIWMVFLLWFDSATAASSAAKHRRPRVQRERRNHHQTGDNVTAAVFARLLTCKHCAPAFEPDWQRARPFVRRRAETTFRGVVRRTRGARRRCRCLSGRSR